MDFGWLTFLAAPWFVIPWYGVGVLGAVWVAYDLNRVNTPLKTAMRWAWPIIVVFFSVLGLALYWTTARAPGIAACPDEAAKKRHHDAYERQLLRRVAGAVIHCVAGDGLGIVTAMVIARWLKVSFWQEFWFEYAVGFAGGWFIFQRRSMQRMSDSTWQVLAMAFRAEFFSMLAVMGGMGAVMAFVTPLAITHQPPPQTTGFWGFAMLGLVVGFVLTYPMNLLMVKVGWKHGMGSPEGVQTAGAGAKPVLIALMVVWGLACMALPAWLMALWPTWPVLAHTPAGPATLDRGLRAAVAATDAAWAAGRHSDAMRALEAAGRLAAVGAAARGPGWSEAHRWLEVARHDVQRGQPQRARQVLAGIGPGLAPLPVLDVVPWAERLGGVAVLDASGVVIGAVIQGQPHLVAVCLGGLHDLWGWWDLGACRRLTVPAAHVVVGPVPRVGWSYVAVRTWGAGPQGIKFTW